MQVRGFGQREERVARLGMIGGDDLVKLAQRPLGIVILEALEQTAGAQGRARGLAESILREGAGCQHPVRLVRIEVLYAHGRGRAGAQRQRCQQPVQRRGGA
jgi:hypothetical protein